MIDPRQDWYDLATECRKALRRRWHGATGFVVVTAYCGVPPVLPQFT